VSDFEFLKIKTGHCILLFVFSDRALPHVPQALPSR